MKDSMERDKGKRRRSWQGGSFGHITVVCGGEITRRKKLTLLASGGFNTYAGKIDDLQMVGLWVLPLRAGGAHQTRADGHQQVMESLI